MINQKKFICRREIFICNKTYSYFRKNIKIIGDKYEKNNDIYFSKFIHIKWNK